MSAQSFDNLGINPLVAWMLVVAVTMVTYAVVLQIKQRLQKRLRDANRRRAWLTRHA